MGGNLLFYINPLSGGDGDGQIIAIRVQDVARDVWFNWDNGVWDTDYIYVTPGAGCLYIAVYVQNQGSPANLTLSILKKGVIIGQQTYYVNTNEYCCIEITTDMDPALVGIELEVTP